MVTLIVHRKGHSTRNNTWAEGQERKESEEVNRRVFRLTVSEPYISDVRGCTAAGARGGPQREPFGLRGLCFFSFLSLRHTTAVY